MAACRAGHDAVAALLLARGSAAYTAASADTFTPQMMYTALHYAASYGHAACTRLLVAAGANVNVRAVKTRLTPLLASLLGGCVAMGVCTCVATASWGCRQR
jgi:ankyrin repeat protein